MINKVFNEDCLIGMKRIPDKSVDMILCDLPYGTTANKWDIIIDFEPLWIELKRICNDNANIILTSDGIFTSKLILSNEKWFKYKMIWDKISTTDFLNANKRPLRQHEDICIFNSGQGIYNPIMRKGKARTKGGKKYANNGCYGDSNETDLIKYDEYYPTSIVQISNAIQTDKIHSTQKPIELFEYLLKTFSNENDLVVDMTMGSGTTAIACINTKRNYIGFEMDETYHKLASERIDKHTKEFNCEVGLFAPEPNKTLF